MRDPHAARNGSGTPPRHPPRARDRSSIAGVSHLRCPRTHRRSARAILRALTFFLRCPARHRMKELDAKVHREFAEHQRCLQENDNKFQKCRETEAALEAAFKGAQ